MTHDTPTDATQPTASDPPASFRAYRYVVGTDHVETIIGASGPEAPPEELIAHAREAIASETFMCYTTSLTETDDASADEICFIPQDGRCEILSIRSNNLQRRFGRRRNLIEILNNLAAAVACGKLHILGAEELERETVRGRSLFTLEIADAGSLKLVRKTVDAALCDADPDEERRQQTILGISEGVTNMLMHGGGHGMITVRDVGNCFRFVLSDQGPGLNFANWAMTPAKSNQASMGYGLKIIIDNFDSVGLHTGPNGTTLVLDHLLN